MLLEHLYFPKYDCASLLVKTNRFGEPVVVVEADLPDKKKVHEEFETLSAARDWVATNLN